MKSIHLILIFTILNVLFSLIIYRIKNNKDSKMFEELNKFRVELPDSVKASDIPDIEGCDVIRMSDINMFWVYCTKEGANKLKEHLIILNDLKSQKRGLK